MKNPCNNCIVEIICDDRCNQYKDYLVYKDLISKIFSDKYYGEDIIKQIFNGPIAQMCRALELQSRSPRFESE